VNDAYKLLNDSIRKAKNKVYYLLRTKARKFENEIAKRICECFVERARQRLLLYSNPKDGVSQAAIAQIVDSITVRTLPDGRGYTVLIPRDEEGLFMYLEYGTGLLGEENGHEESGGGYRKLDWQYNIGDPDIRTIYGSWVFSRDGKRSSPAYVDDNDINPIITTKKYKTEPTRVRATTTKKGPRKSFIRKPRKHESAEKTIIAENAVMSKGIAPVRYIYNTKMEIFELYRTLKSFRNGELTIQDVYDAIEELRRRPV
jgi:hypothetical protein